MNSSIKVWTLYNVRELEARRILCGCRKLEEARDQVILRLRNTKVELSPLVSHLDCLSPHGKDCK